MNARRLRTRPLPHRLQARQGLQVPVFDRSGEFPRIRGKKKPSEGLCWPETDRPWIPPAVIVGVMLYLHRVTRQDVAQLRHMKQMEARLESRMDRMESRMGEDMKRLDGRVARLEHGQAKLEGLLEGLREAITRQNVA